MGRKAAWVALAVVLVAGGYVGFAAHDSHAAVIGDGVIYWPSYHQFQTEARSGLVDPDSAEFQHLYFRKVDGTQYMCGLINARNRMGGFVGFRPFYVGGGTTVISDEDDPASAYSVKRICLS